MTLTETQRNWIIRDAGRAFDESELGGVGPEGFAGHLAAHSVLEEHLTGHCTKTLNMEAPCPYCGKLPPGMKVPHAAAVLS